MPGLPEAGGQAVSALSSRLRRPPPHPVHPALSHHGRRKGVQPEQPPSHFLPPACPQGRFGPSCAHVCRCGQGATCDPVTGTCACPPGRTGSHCEHGEWGFACCLGRFQASPHRPRVPAGGEEWWVPWHIHTRGLYEPPPPTKGSLGIRSEGLVCVDMQCPALVSGPSNATLFLALILAPDSGHQVTCPYPCGQ